jgi:integrase
LIIHKNYGSVFNKKGTCKLLFIRDLIKIDEKYVPKILLTLKIGTMNTKLKSAEHLDENELNRLLKYLNKNENHLYYLLIRLGISTALRYSDLSRITWSMVLNKSILFIKEKKTNKVREIPIHIELQETIAKSYVKLGSKDPNSVIIPLNIRTINKQLKIHASKAGIRNRRISTHSFRKIFGREVWRRNGQTESSLVKLSSLFNHSSVSITRIYLSITKEEVDDLYNMQDMFTC